MKCLPSTLSLGFINGIMNNVKTDTLLAALVEVVGNKSVELNRQALALGFQTAQEMLNK